MTTAIAADAPAVVAAVLDAGLSPDADLGLGMHPLHRAAIAGDLDVVTLLVDRGADIDAQGPDLVRPLMLAIQYGNNDIVEFLINAGADVNTPFAGQYGKRPIHFAAEYRNLRALSLLLDAGVDPDQVEATRSTALVYAAYRGETDMVRELLARGADPNIPDAYGNSPLELAYVNYNPAIIEALTNAGAVA